MDNVSADMLRFKEAVRHIWNTYFGSQDSSMLPEIQSSFQIIEQELLRSIVLIPRDMAQVADLYRAGALEQIVVRPKSLLTELPIQYAKIDERGNVCWQMPTSISVDDFPQCRFVEFFDWTPNEQVDLPYVRIFIIEDGRSALIEQLYCDFYLTDE